MIFNKVKVHVAVWPPFGRELLIRFSERSRCIWTYWFLKLFQTLVLIASSLGHCSSFTSHGCDSLSFNALAFQL